MEQEARKQIVITVEIDSDLKRWIERKAAERMIAGRPHGERSMGAVIRDLIIEAQRKDLVAA